jgi:chromosome segregation ATPase
MQAVNYQSSILLTIVANAIHKEKEDLLEKEKMKDTISFYQTSINDLEKQLDQEKSFTKELSSKLQSFESQNAILNSNVEQLSISFNQTKEQLQQVTQQEVQLKNELETERKLKEELNETTKELKETTNLATQQAQKLLDEKLDLDAIIAELMKFPDLSLGNEFKISGM